MAAGVPREDRFKAADGEFFGECLIVEDGAKMFAHLGAVSRDEVIDAGPEESFGILPRRADEGDSASECFKGTDRGDAWQLSRVRAAGHVHGYAETREEFGHAEVGQPAAVLNAGGGECLLRGFRVADPKYFRVEVQRFGRLDQELVQFGRALIVAPVADPDQVAFTR